MKLIGLLTQHISKHISTVEFFEHDLKLSKFDRHFRRTQILPN